MYRVRIDGTEFSADVEYYLCPTLTYLIIRFEEDCIVGRTLEDCEIKSLYSGMLADINGKCVVTLEKGISYS